MNKLIELIPRQKAILNLLAQFEVLSREHITDKLKMVYPVSKATLARDLSDLLVKGQIIAEGRRPITHIQT